MEFVWQEGKKQDLIKSYLQKHTLIIKTDKKWQQKDGERYAMQAINMRKMQWLC